MIEQNVGHHYTQSYTNKTIRHEHSYKQPEVKTNRNNETDIIRNIPIKLLLNQTVLELDFRAIYKYI